MSKEKQIRLGENLGIRIKENTKKELKKALGVLAIACLALNIHLPIHSPSYASEPTSLSSSPIVQEVKNPFSSIPQIKINNINPSSLSPNQSNQKETLQQQELSLSEIFENLIVSKEYVMANPFFVKSLSPLLDSQGNLSGIAVISQPQKCIYDDPNITHGCDSNGPEQAFISLKEEDGRFTEFRPIYEFNSSHIGIMEIFTRQNNRSISIAGGRWIKTNEFPYSKEAPYYITSYDSGKTWIEEPIPDFPRTFIQHQLGDVTWFHPLVRYQQGNNITFKETIAPTEIINSLTDPMRAIRVNNTIRGVAGYLYSQTKLFEIRDVYNPEVELNPNFNIPSIPDSLDVQWNPSTNYPEMVALVTGFPTLEIYHVNDNQQAELLSVYSNIDYPLVGYRWFQSLRFISPNRLLIVSADDGRNNTNPKMMRAYFDIAQINNDGTITFLDSQVFFEFPDNYTYTPPGIRDKFLNIVKVNGKTCILGASVGDNELGQTSYTLVLQEINPQTGEFIGNPMYLVNGLEDVLTHRTFLPVVVNNN